MQRHRCPLHHVLPESEDECWPAGQVQREKTAANWCGGWAGQRLKYIPLSTHPTHPFLFCPSFHLLLLSSLPSPSSSSSSFSVYASDTCCPLNGHMKDPPAPPIAPSDRDDNYSKQVNWRKVPIIWQQCTAQMLLWTLNVIMWFSDIGPCES